METVFSTNQKIINTLLLNASFIDNLGLMHGKMGISIFFFHLARQTKNKIYEDYAGELIDEIYEEITINTPVDFENGLAGIGWGIEYLVQNCFIEADTDEVLEEFDNRIFKELIYNTPKDIGLLKGIIGIGTYFLKRIQNPASSDEKIPTLTNKQTLIHLIDELDRRTNNISEIISEPSPAHPSGSPEGENLRTNAQSKKSASEDLVEKIPEQLKVTTEYSPDTSYQDCQTSKPLNNNQTLEPSNNRQTFDLTWNYPALLWFLAELYEQNIFNFKVEKIIQRLVEPLSDETNLPKLQSNRLLLALALTKLQQTLTEKLQTKNHKPRTTNHEQQTTNNNKPSNFSNQVELSNFSNIEKRISNLFSGINRNTIKSELAPNSATLRYGTSGIAWIYQQLHRQTHDNHFKEEMEYWQKQSFESEKPNEIFSSINYKNLNGWGLLEGLADMLIGTEKNNSKKTNKQYNS